MAHSDSDPNSIVTASLPQRIRKKGTKTQTTRRKKSSSTSPSKRARSSKRYSKRRKITMEDLTYYPAKDSCFDPDKFGKDLLGIESSIVVGLGKENMFTQKEYYRHNILMGHENEETKDSEHSEHSEHSKHIEQSDHSDQSDDMILLRMMSDL